MSNHLRVVVKAPGEPPLEKTIPHTLEALQHEVGGYIEMLRMGDWLVLVNEEGKLRQLPPNISLAPYGWLVGTIVVLAQDARDPAEFASLDDGQAAAVVERLSVRAGH